MRGWSRDAFLVEFRATGLIATACRAVGVARSTVYAERHRNEEFAFEWQLVNDELVGTLEDEAFRRAVDGVERMVVSCGRIVGTERVYSDYLLLALLKARLPEKYCDRVRVVHVPAPVEKLDLSRLSGDEFETLDRLLRKAAGEEPDADESIIVSNDDRTLISNEGSRSRPLVSNYGSDAEPDASRPHTHAREAGPIGGAA